MAKYHIGTKGIGRCFAFSRCPFGGESGFENHYDSKDKALKAFEKDMGSSIFPQISSAKGNTFEVFSPEKHSKDSVGVLDSNVWSIAVIEKKMWNKEITLSDALGSLNTSPEFISQIFNGLKNNRDENLFLIIARNPQTPEWILHTLSRDRNNWVSLSENPKLPASIVNALYPQSNFSLHRLLSNPNIDPKFFDQIMETTIQRKVDKNGSHSVLRLSLEAAASNPLNTPENLDNIADIGFDSSILGSVLANPRTSSETLKRYIAAPWEEPFEGYYSYEDRDEEEFRIRNNHYSLIIEHPNVTLYTLEEIVSFAKDDNISEENCKKAEEKIAQRTKI